MRFVLSKERALLTLFCVINMHYVLFITAVTVEDAGVKEGNQGVLQRAGRAGAGVDTGGLGAGGVERGLALDCGKYF